MTTPNPYRGQVVAAYRVAGELIVQGECGRCFAIGNHFNAWADRQFRPRSILTDRPWQVQRLSLSAIPAQTRCPVKGQSLPAPLSQNLTAQGINKRRAAKGLEPLHDDYAEAENAEV